MQGWNRRDWMKTLGGGALGLGVARRSGADSTAEPKPACPPGTLSLSEFQPRSMLHVPVTKVATPRFPVIDVHTHLSFMTKSKKGVSVGDQVSLEITAADALAVMDRKGIRAMVNLTGGNGAGLEKAIAALDRAAPGRFFTCTEPIYGEFLDPRYPQLQADAIGKAKRAGARGLKIVKALGLYLREQIAEGPLVKIDDRRFDPMWEACAAAGLPVFIHIADPEAFFLPIDRYNERWDELGHHPDWSFYGQRLPDLQGPDGGPRPHVRAPPEDARSWPCTSATTPRTWPSCRSLSTASRT